MIDRTGARLEAECRKTEIKGDVIRTPDDPDRRRKKYAQGNGRRTAEGAGVVEMSEQHANKRRNASEE